MVHTRIEAWVRPMTLRIYADFNGLVAGPEHPGRLAVVLDTFGSLRDLSNAGIALSEGLPLIGVDWSDDDEDLEGHGIAVYDHDREWWVIEFDELGVRYVPAGDRSTVQQFLCVSCRADLTATIEALSRGPSRSCARCGTPFDAALAPPGQRRP